jgi:hypothetical protein
MLTAMKIHSITSKVKQSPCTATEIHDPSTIIADQLETRTHFCQVARHWSFKYQFHFLGIRFYSFSISFVPQELYFVLKESALFRVELQSSALNSINNFGKTFHVFIKGVRKHANVVQVTKTGKQFKPVKTRSIKRWKIDTAFERPTAGP